MSETSSKPGNRLIVGVVLTFIGVVLFFFFIFSGFGIIPLYSAVLSLVAGAFVVFIIMAVTGILKEFSIKSPLLEMTSTLRDEIEKTSPIEGIKKQETAKKKIGVLADQTSKEDVDIIVDYLKRWEHEQKSKDNAEETREDKKR